MRTKLNKSIKFIGPAIVMAAFAMPASANQYNDVGRVLTVNPMVERVNSPRQDCRTEYQQQSYQEQRGIGGALVGGVAGGLIGSAIGQGNGRVVAAAVGAGVGAIAGDRIANQNNGTVVQTLPVQACYQVDNWSNVTTGYNVTYEYQGRTYNTVTQQHPGQFINVNVAVAPNMPSPVHITNITYGSPAYVTPSYVTPRYVGPIVIAPRIVHGGGWYGNNYRTYDHRFRGNSGKHGWNHNDKHSRNFR
jgi:uncharacterized protein YcfJ